MKITKLEHSGLMVENQGRVLLCDPVEIEQKLPEFKNVVAMVITHEHFDHCDLDIIARIRAQNPQMKTFTTEANATQLADATAVVDGDMVNVDGFDLHFFGAKHARIVPNIMPCQNIGIVINGCVAHPGDAFVLPPEKVAVLCTPVAGPWCKTMEVLDYVRTVQPRLVVPLHDAVLSKLGKKINDSWLYATATEIGAEYRALEVGESIEL